MKFFNRTTIIVGIVVLLIAAIAYVQTRRPAASSGTSQSDSETSERLPSSVANAVLRDSKILYLDTSTGNFATYNLETKKSTQLSEYLINSSAVRWSPDGNYILNVSADDGAAMVIAVNGGDIVPLNTQVLTPTWSGDGRKILYQFFNQQQASVITSAQADGTDWESIVSSSVVFRSIWWSPMGTYAVGLNPTTSPQEYDLIAISSKKVTKLAAGYGNLAWSPSGTLALLDSNDAKTLTVANLETRELITLDVPGFVRQFTWQDETHLIGFSQQKLVSIDLATKGVKSIEDAPGITNFSEVLGIFNNHLYYVQDGTISSVRLK